MCVCSRVPVQFLLLVLDLFFLVFLVLWFCFIPHLVETSNTASTHKRQDASLLLQTVLLIVQLCSAEPRTTDGQYEPCPSSRSASCEIHSSVARLAQMALRNAATLFAKSGHGTSVSCVLSPSTCRSLVYFRLCKAEIEKRRFSDLGGGGRFSQSWTHREFIV